MGRLSGKVAVVTGASKGIGAAIAKAMGADGAAVVVNYASSKPDADAVVNTIVRAGGRTIAILGDVSKPADARRIADAAGEHFGRLDIVVNNAGVFEWLPLNAVTEESFHGQFNVNVLGLLLITQAAVMLMTDGGSVINIGSNASRSKPENGSIYAASKGAVDTITGVLAKELASRKIRRS
jgi:3-oxoacyl-[acyl-carrier protein] reductase